MRLPRRHRLARLCRESTAALLFWMAATVSPAAGLQPTRTEVGPGGNVAR